MRRSRPLPVRVAPHDDEAWNGYLDRVAATHRMRPAELGKYLGLREEGMHRWSHRDSGITLTAKSREVFAIALNLTEDEVRRTQLQRFNGRLLDLPDTTITALDPLASNPPGRPWLFLRGRGWLRWRPKTHGCRDCLSVDPSHWKLSWRVPWTLFCPLHACLIDDLRAEPVTIRSTDAQLAAQARMLDIAYAVEPGRADELFGYAFEVGAAVDLLVRHQNSSFHLNALADVRPSARAVANVLPDALALVDDVRAGAQSELMPVLFADAEHQQRACTVFKRHGVPTSSRLSLVAGMYRLSDDPRPWRSWRVSTDCAPRLSDRVAARIPDCVPQMLPMDLFAGDLSDLLYPLPIEHGRTVAAVACVLVCGRPTLGDAVAALVLPHACRRPIYAELARLHAHGRETAFFAAAVDAATELARRNIDWAARRWPTHGAPHPLVVPMLKDLGEIAHPRVLRQWIHEVWAAGHWDSWLPTAQARMRRRRFVEELDECHHDELVAAAERAAAAIAPAPRRALAS